MNPLNSNMDWMVTFTTGFPEDVPELAVGLCLPAAGQLWHTMLQDPTIYSTHLGSPSNLFFMTLFFVLIFLPVLLFYLPFCS